MYYSCIYLVSVLYKPRHWRDHFFLCNWGQVRHVVECMYHMGYFTGDGKSVFLSIGPPTFFNSYQICFVCSCPCLPWTKLLVQLRIRLSFFFLDSCHKYVYLVHFEFNKCHFTTTWGKYHSSKLSLTSFWCIWGAPPLNSTIIKANLYGKSAN